VIVCFDTSAINALYDDPDKRRVTDAIRARAVLRLSEVNVIEVVQTTRAERRQGLLRLMNEFSDGTLPLAEPMIIVRRIAAAHARGESGFSTSIDPDRRNVGQALRSPELIDDYSKGVGKQWSGHVNNEFDSIAVSMREAAQRARPAAEEPWFRSASAAIRFLMISPGAQFRRFAAMMYAMETGNQPNEEGLKTVTSHPAWQLFFAATVFAMQRRSMRAERFARSRVANGADLHQAVYLAFCDVFVTFDKGQQRALRFLNALNRSSATKVESYPSFRKQYS